jgi:hypothetical protein
MDGFGDPSYEYGTALMLVSGTGCLTYGMPTQT